MASWKDFSDAKLKKEFEKKGPDPRAAEKLRSRFTKSLDTALGQFLATEPTKGRKMWKAQNNVVEFSPVFNGSPVSLDGETTLYIPSERFSDFVGALKQSVAAGELDAVLEGPEGVKTTAKSGGTRTFSDQSRLNIRVGGFRRGGMDDAAIKAKLKGEGVDGKLIDAALARKSAGK